MLWTTSTESMLSLLTAGLDWTLQFVPHFVTPSPRPPTHLTRTPCPLFMYLYEFDYSLAAVCAHHVISAAFQSDKHHSSIWVSVQGIQASLDVQLSFVFSSPPGSFSAHSASTDDPFPAGHHRTWRYCQQCIVSFSRTIYIFLKRKILPAIYIKPF